MRDRTPAGVRFVPAAPQVRGSIPAGCEPIAKETETLRTRVAELETKLEQFQKERTLAEGTPLAKPAALPERFNDAALRENVTKALKEAGIPGDVTSVDCTEYPCIVYGKAGKRGDMDKLEATASMKGYGADHHSTHEWGVGSKQPDGTSKDELYFGMALYPKVDGETEAQKDEITKRLQVRQQEMWEAMRPRSGK